LPINSMSSLAINRDTAALVLALRNGVGFCLSEAYSVLEITGADAAPFLQNRLSSDVLSLKAGDGHLSAALDRQGRIEGLFSLHCLSTDAGGVYLLLTDTAEADHLRAAILRFKIIEQVAIRDLSNETCVFLVQGPHTTALLDKLVVMTPQERAWPEFSWQESSLSAQPDIMLRLFRRSVTGEDGVFLLVNATHAKAVEQALEEALKVVSGIHLSEEALEVLRVEAGLPRFGRDYTHETPLPETGLERLAVSYDKGCYLGQETVAKIRTYGGAPRLLCGLLLPPDLGEAEWKTLQAHPSLTTSLHVEGREMGRLGSLVLSGTLDRPIAIAALGRQERIPGKTLAITIGTQTYQATVTLLPFVHSVQAAHFLETEPTQAQALLKEALKLFSQNQEDQARALLRDAIAQDPMLAEAHEALGVITARQETPEAYREAIAYMERLLELEPDHVLAHTNLSVYYMKLGDKEKAEAEKGLATMASFRAAMRDKAPISTETPELTAEKVAQEKAQQEEQQQKKQMALQEKVVLFQNALQFSPDDPLGNFGLASALLELGRYEEAIVPFQKTITAQPKQSTAYLSLGKALEASGRSNEAMDIYRKGVEVAAAKGDLMPLQAMQARLAAL
jgi:folate-binding protein YgfZ